MKLLNKGEVKAMELEQIIGDPDRFGQYQGERVSVSAHRFTRTPMGMAIRLRAKPSIPRNACENEERRSVVSATRLPYFLRWEKAMRDS